MALTAAVTETEICNGALSMLGVDERLGDVETDATVNARRCRLAYPRARDALLSAYPWNFAARRASLPAFAADPAWGFATQVLLPADFLRLRHLNGAGQADRYVIESTADGRMLLCDLAAPLDILYTARITSAGFFDSLFVDALTARLAADLAMPVTQTRSLFETMAVIARNRIEEAQVADAREGTAGDSLPAGSWVESRR